MKKSFIITSLVMAMGLFTACDSDRDDNPTLTMPETFTLNAPAIAENNVIDLANTETITITCNQPDYGGYPLVTEYTVEYSTTEDFAEGTTFRLPSSYTQTKIDLPAKTMNTTIIEDYQATHGEGTSPEDFFPLYIRLLAKPSKVDVNSIVSNTIKLNVKASYKTPDVTIPDDLYVVGSNIGNGWDLWQKLAHPYNTKGVYYTVVYMPEGGGQFMFGTKENDWNGHSAISEINGNDLVNITAAADDNVVFDKGGWFTLEFIAKIKGGALVYTLNVYPAKVFITGNACGGFPDKKVMLECTAPADNHGEWVSPAFIASGEMRAYINVPGREWWRTEFTLKDGTDVFFRETTDIPNDWATNVGPAYSVSASAGQKLYVNFETGKGSVK